MQYPSLIAHEVHYAAVIDACARGGNPVRAVSWLENMIAKSLNPGRNGHGAVTNSFSQLGDTERALKWLHAPALSTVVRRSATLIRPSIGSIPCAIAEYPATAYLSMS